MSIYTETLITMRETLPRALATLQTPSHHSYHSQCCSESCVLQLPVFKSWGQKHSDYWCRAPSSGRTCDPGCPSSLVTGSGNAQLLAPPQSQVALTGKTLNPWDMEAARTAQPTTLRREDARAAAECDKDDGSTFKGRESLGEGLLKTRALL